MLDVLATLPADSVHCVVSSPPYYGLRDYGIDPQVWGGDPSGGCEHEWGDERITEAGRNDGGRDIGGRKGNYQGNGPHKSEVKAGAFCRHCNAWRGSFGLEPTLDLYLDHMVEICREIRRVLRKDGTFWLNIGDSYASGGTGGASPKSTLTGGGGRYRDGSKLEEMHECAQTRKPPPGFKPKDLMLIPSRLAIRLCDDGWWVRSDIAWCKRATMPESVTDRPTSAWEHVFLMTKSAKYFYDAEAVKEDGSGKSAGNHTYKYDGVPGHETKQGILAVSAVEWCHRNLRNFWLLGPSPFPEAHFATFPPEIPRRCILAGTSERGVCPKCGAPWARVTQRIDQGWDGSRYGERALNATGGTKTGGTAASTLGSANGKLTGQAETIGWQPTCGCDPGDPVPATVLDPFFGAGTTGLVADQLQRDCIGIDLSVEYIAMAEHRVRNDAPLFVRLDVQESSSQPYLGEK